MQLIKQSESLVTKKWLQLPQSAIRVVLYYPGICCPSVSQVSREAKLSLLSCVCTSSDPRLQELGLLGLHLHLGDCLLKFQNLFCGIPIANFPICHQHNLCTKKAKEQLSSVLVLEHETHLKQLTVQCEFLGSVRLETICETWSQLLTGFHPGQLFFLLQTHCLLKSTCVVGWHIQCTAKCALCDSNRLTTGHILGSCPIALSQQ